MKARNGSDARSNACSGVISLASRGRTPATNAVRNIASEMSTALGGAVAVPRAVRSNESTTTMRVNDVTITRIEGASDSTVSSAINCNTRSVSPPPWPNVTLMSCAKAGVTASTSNAPTIAQQSLRSWAGLNPIPANHRAAARLSPRNGTRECGEGLLLLGRTAEQARHFLFEAVEDGFRFGVLVAVARGIVRRRRGRSLAAGQFLRLGGGLWSA